MNRPARSSEHWGNATGHRRARAVTRPSRSIVKECVGGSMGPRNRQPASSKPRTAWSGRPDSSGARRARPRRARVVEHVSRLQPDEAAIRTRERERLHATIDSGAAGDVLQRDTLVPAMPVLTATERTRHARVAAPQEVKDPLRGLSYLPLRSPDAMPLLPGRWPHARALFAEKNLASRAAAVTSFRPEFWMQRQSEHDSPSAARW
jgi:hypothetical protein